MIVSLKGIDLGREILIFLDYDGTLVAIRREPRLAVLSAARRRFLESLSDILRVGIVSGRSLDELRGLVRVDGISYVGNHGLEILSGRRCWIHPGALRARPVLKKALGRIRRKIDGIPGVLVEDKVLTASVHVRGADPSLRPRVLEIMEEEIRSRRSKLKITSGKMVFEIRPNVRWDKGQGVLKASRWMKGDGTAIRVYVGDDRTDEDAFRALGGEDLTIHVGRNRDTAARFRIRDVDHVWEFLGSLRQKLLAGR
jgi:trehalose 6-phosphate phosphatase